MTEHRLGITCTHEAMRVGVTSGASADLGYLMILRSSTIIDRESFYPWTIGMLLDWQPPYKKNTTSEIDGLQGQHFYGCMGILSQQRSFYFTGTGAEEVSGSLKQVAFPMATSMSFMTSFRSPPSLMRPLSLTNTMGSSGFSSFKTHFLSCSCRSWRLFSRTAPCSVSQSVTQELSWWQLNVKFRTQRTLTSRLSIPWSVMVNGHH